MSWEITSIFSAARLFYDKYARRYKDASKTFSYFTAHPVAPLNKARTELIINHAKAAVHKKQAVAIDFACGGGIITAALARAGFRVYGIDPDKKEIALAKTFNQYVHSNAHFIVGDTFAPWETQLQKVVGKKADILVFGYALHHFTNVEEFIDRLGEYAPTGTAIIVNEENPQSLLFQLKNFVRTLIQNDTECEHQRTVAEWKNMFEKAGFSLVSTSAADFFPFSLLDAHYRWSYVLTFIKDK